MKLFSEAADYALILSKKIVIPQTIEILEFNWINSHPIQARNSPHCLWLDGSIGVHTLASVDYKVQPISDHITPSNKPD